MQSHDTKSLHLGGGLVMYYGHAMVLVCYLPPQTHSLLALLLSLADAPADRSMRVWILTW